MHVVALCKSYRGHEWVEAMIESVYNHVDAIVVVNGETGWAGDTRGNSVRAVVRDWASRGDDLGKVVQLDYRGRPDQRSQYEVGLAYIREVFPECAWIMLVDTDEVWDEEDLLRARAQLEAAPADVNAFTCRMVTYVKSPFWRVMPPEPCDPTVFVRPGRPLDGVRGNKVRPRALLENVRFHHMTYVRDDEEEVFEKIRASTLADGAPLVDLKRWRREVWDKLPEGTNLHTTRGCEHCWQRLESVDISALPFVLRRHRWPLLEAWMPKPSGLPCLPQDFTQINRGQLLYPELQLLMRAAMGKRVVEVGTGWGTTTGFLAMVAADMLSLDVFEDLSEAGLDAGSLEVYQSTFAGRTHQYVSGTLLPYHDNLQVVRGRSVDVAATVSDASQGLVFIDADHSYAGVKGDAAAWAPKVAPGGVLAFHDARSGWGGAVKAVEEFAHTPGWKELLGVGTIRVFQREDA